jgi:hypothetical protein
MNKEERKINRKQLIVLYIEKRVRGGYNIENAVFNRHKLENKKMIDFINDNDEYFLYNLQ